MKIILHWVALSIAVFITTQITLIKGLNVSPIWIVLIVGACLTLINMFIKPIIKILTLPINILTLGLFSLVINGLIFWYLGSGIIKGFFVDGFAPAFWGALVISILNWIITKILKID